MKMIGIHRAGAVALVLGALVAAAVPAAAADECPDAWITMKITTRFMGKTGWSLFKIDVDTDDCVVTLSGCVNSPDHRAHAVEQAGKVKKVRQVNDQLTICPSDGEDEGSRHSESRAEKAPHAADQPQSCADALITAEVKSSLMANDGLQAFDIDVETEECRVTLEGCVDTPRQRKKAVRLANQADGVRGVHSELSLCPTG